VGTLRIGPSLTTVQLVDSHDNDGTGQASAEAIYAQHLVIEAGAHLDSDGHHVYYQMLTLLGTVDDPASLIEVGPPCPGDTDGNGQVDVDDLTAVILDWGTDGSQFNGDVDGSGIVDVDDLTAVILAWGPCG
jgi:hypothetical protein